MEENIHTNHRQRLRKLFENTGENMDDINLLELMLFYAIPRHNTNTIAHALLDRFGSFDLVLEASKEELMQVRGIGESAATYLTMFLPIFKNYHLRKQNFDFDFQDKDTLRSFIAGEYMNVKTERAMIIHFNAAGEYINRTWISEGDLDSVMLDNRKIASAVIENKASLALLVHNHPSGISNPSNSDLDAASNLAAFLKTIKVKLIDCAIVSRDGISFFSEISRFYKYIV